MLSRVGANGEMYAEES